MKNNELRIGNWVLMSDELYLEYYNIQAHDFCSSMFEKFEPIPLTEEWLLKFEALKDENNDLFIYVDKENDLRLYLTNGFIQVCKNFFCPYFNYKHIVYVHQLQNLYFALTGKELKTIKI